MNPQRVNELLARCSNLYRKGEVMQQSDRPGIRVTEVYMMPHQSEAPAELQQQDVHFVIVGVDPEEARQIEPELLQEMLSCPDMQTLLGGPSYIHAGGWLDSQELALQLFGVGQALGWWKIQMPELMGFQGEEADKLARASFVHAVPGPAFRAKLQGVASNAP